MREMKQGWGSLAGVALLLLGAAAPLHAQPVQPDKGASTLYSDALTAMRGEDYSSAVQLFARARQAGLNSSALHYNNGVALYRLGRYQQAKDSFVKAEERGEGAALVHYNLGLSCYRLQQGDEARRWFQLAASGSGNPRLAEMAEEMLARLDEEDGAVDVVAEKSPWSLMAELKLGVDDNVTLENSELAQATTLDDSYRDLYASARYQLSGDTRSGYWGQLSAASLQYRQYDAYDYSQYDLGLFRDGAFGVLATRAGLRLSRSDLGGSGYLQKYTLRLQGDYPLSESQTLRARYDISRYDPLDSSYSYLAGLKGSLTLESIWRLEGRRFRLGYELENNSRDDYLSGNNFISYSATRHEVSAAVTQPAGADWHFTLGGDYRLSRYNDADIVAGITGVPREDRRWRWNLEAGYRLNRHLDLVAEYQYTNNDSNILSRSYQRNQYTLGVQGYF